MPARSAELAIFGIGDVNGQTRDFMEKLVVLLEKRAAKVELLAIFERILVIFVPFFLTIDSVGLVRGID